MNTSRDDSCEFIVKVNSAGDFTRFDLMDCTEEAISSLSTFYLEPTQSMLLIQDKGELVAVSINAADPKELETKKDGSKMNCPDSYTLDSQWTRQR
ncbi:MAG TPA: hypothetical protein VGE40_10630 [Bacilli bacterium]